MQTIEIEKRKPSYFERNHWLRIILLVLIVNASVYICAYVINDFLQAGKVSTGYASVVRFFWVISIVPVVYAGFLNYMADTLSAKLFRVFLVAALIGGFIYALFF